MTSPILVDTDVFSYWLKNDTRGAAYSRDAEGKSLCLSFMSVAETKRWALSRGWGVERRQRLSTTVAKYIVLPYDEPLADVWAEIANHRAKIGRPIESGDCWIAATTVRHGMPLITHNTRHYTDIPSLHVVSHR